MFIKQLIAYMVLTVSFLHRETLGDLINNSSVTCDDVESFNENGTSTFVDDALTWTTRCLRNGAVGGPPWKEPLALVNGTVVDNSALNISKDSNLPVKQDTADWYITFKRFQFVTTGIYFPFVTCAAFLGNILAIIVLCKGYVQSSSYVYLLGLAGANLVFSVTYSPKLFRAYDSVKALRSYQSFYSYYVVYLSPLAPTAQTSGVWVIILFTIERFVAIAFPMKAQSYFSVTRSKIAVSAAFILGFVLNFNRFFRREVVAKIDPVTGEHYYSYTLSALGRNEAFDAITFWSYLILTEIIPFPILVTLNSIIIRKVWQARFNRIKLSAGNEQRDNKASRENQITRLLISISVAFLFCNVAACAASMYVAINGSSSLYTLSTPELYYLFSVAATLYNTNPFVNCILYTVCSEAMRKGMKSVLCVRGSEKIDTSKTLATSVTAE